MVKRMKRMMLFAGLALLLTTACSKADHDYFGGHIHKSDNPVQEYMLTLADDLLIASLEELDEALRMNPKDPVTQVLYDTKGDDLLQPGSEWKLRRECPLRGLVLRCETIEGQTAWNLVYEGDLSLAGECYPTRFSIRLRPKDEGQDLSPYDDWSVFEFSGTRTEREGYKCTFGLASTTITIRPITKHSWNPYGSLRMTVFKNEETVDIAYLTLAGPPSASTFAHGQTLNI